MRHKFIAITVALIVLVLAVGQQTFAGKVNLETLQMKVRQMGYTFEVGPNPATEYSLDQLCGTRVPEVRRPRIKSVAAEEDYILSDTFDWRKLDGCTEIKNQTPCGSCWAFAALGITESVYLIEKGKELDLSEQWLISCTDSGTCYGGWYQDALDYLIDFSDHCSEIGAPMESDFPYEAKDISCACPEEERFLITDWSEIDEDIDTIKWAIQTYGPIAVTVHAGELFQCYVGGIFNADEQGDLNHAVVLVGWDDNQGTEGVWFLRNSWDVGWGESGYMRIEYGKNKVGSVPCYAELIEETEPNKFEVPAMFPTIQAAMEVAGNKDIIILAPGVYTGADNTNINFMGKNVMICSGNPSDPEIVKSTVIDCEGSADHPGRGFIFANGEDRAAGLNGLTVRNGYTTDNGGAVYCYYSDPTFKNCNFENNKAVGYRKAGGAMALYNSTPVIYNCRFTNNYATGYGGGISCRDSSCAKISYCKILGNEAGYEGGGLYCWVNSVVSVKNSVIADNHAGDAGGGVFFYECTYETEPNSLSGMMSVEPEDTESTDPNTTSIKFCTIADNSTEGLGGGLFCTDSIIRMSNSILWNNTSPEQLGDQIVMMDDSLEGTILYLDYCDLTGLDQGHFIGNDCTLAWGVGNFDADPLFVNISEWDYHLKSASGHWDDTIRQWILDDGGNYDSEDDQDSPCIDAGDPGLYYAHEFECNGNRVNIGTYGGTNEASRSPYETCCMQCMRADFNCDCIVNLEDLIVMAEDWLRCNLLPRHECIE